MIQLYKNPIAKRFLMDFCIVIMKVLNNYDRTEKFTFLFLRSNVGNVRVMYEE